MKTKTHKLLLALDIGNTTIHAGVFLKRQLIYQWQIKSNPNHSTSTYHAHMLAARAATMAANPTLNGQITHAIISSVVPALKETFTQICREMFSITPTVVGPDLDMGLKLDYRSLATLGADRITNGVAARTLYGDKGPVIVVDAGTAITMDVITREGVFKGGAILPGLSLIMRALTGETATLPAVPLQVPPKAIGQTTTECIQSGVCLGMVCMVDGLLEKMESEVGEPCTMVTTGGNGPFLMNHSSLITIHEPHLTLTGLEIIHTKVTVPT